MGGGRVQIILWGIPPEAGKGDGFAASGRRVPFVMIQKEPKNHLREGGFRFPPSLRKPIPLKRPKGGCGPLYGIPPGDGPVRIPVAVGIAVGAAHLGRPVQAPLKRGLSPPPGGDWGFLPAGNEKPSVICFANATSLPPLSLRDISLSPLSLCDISP